MEFIMNNVTAARAFCLSIIFSLLILIQACATNPVTGKREISFVSESQEISIGKENYIPSQQSQGGQYVADPKLTPYVKSIGNKLVSVSDRPTLPYDFVVLNNPVPNAWALPGGKIAINTGLLVELKNEAELAAVIGHEIVHAAARHGAKSMERGMLLQAGVAGLGVALGEKENSNLIVGAAALGSNLISQKYGRDAESESDLYGMRYMVKLGYNPIAAVTLQETFVRLSKSNQPNWLEGLFASHPPSQDRVEANKQTAIQLGGNKGILGEKQYQAKIAHLLKAQPAYKDLAEGQKALKEGDTDKAITLAKKAIAIEPNESLFDNLIGDAYFKSNRYQQADEAYSAAIKKNPNFFLHYLGRGMTRNKLLKNAASEKDLQRSIDLLPTAPALNLLGDLTKNRGDAAKAKEFYKLAAESNSFSGQQAAKSYATLDLPENPKRYIEATAAITRIGGVAIKLINHAPVKVGNISIDVAVLTAQNKILQMETYKVKDNIDAGGKLIFATNLLLGRATTGDNLRTNVTYAEAVSP
jgi:predicted Zn-dependent protease